MPHVEWIPVFFLIFRQELTKSRADPNWNDAGCSVPEFFILNLFPASLRNTFRTP